ncbi:MAG: glycoside hydrolase family 2 protein [Prevotella sp.]|jgi:beta-galactosidase
MKQLMMKTKWMIGLLLTMTYLQASARQTYNFNSAWTMSHPHKTVTLPHAWNEDEAFRVSTYETSTAVVWYRKHFKLPKSAAGKRVFIEFEGARQAAEVWLNGHKLGLSENGVMAFGFDMTPYIKKGDNFIEVKTDNDWNYREQSSGTRYQWASKPFNVNYGGLPKNVWLHVTDQVYQTLPLYSNLATTGTYIYGYNYDVAHHTATVHAESQVKNETDKAVTRGFQVIVSEMDGREVARFNGPQVTIPAHGCSILSAEERISKLHFWSWGYGYLYKVKTILTDNGQPTDEVTTVTGFRKTEFKQGLFYLNDRVIMVHGYAQRSSNEWPGVGMSVPAWLSDYSNDLLVKSGGNLVRWMHITPWKQDVESCDRVGLIEAMPAGDAEHDATGRQWQQRLLLMRDAIIYNRNNPSIIFYECGNQRISGQHMREMKALRNQFDPYGGRAIGSREMLDQPEAEYGGEMLYVNKSDTKPVWMMEYCRDEGLRWYWNSWSYPYHKEGDGPLYRNAPATSYNHNQDEFTKELVRRWYDYWLERPGTGTKVNSGGAKIIFSDTQSHGRSADNYRVSGVVDPMRIPKDPYFAHQVMWDGWVDDLKPRTYIVGHWNYKPGFKVPTIYVVSNADSVILKQGGKVLRPDSHDYHFLYTFHNVLYTDSTLEAIGMDLNGKEVSSYTLHTAGEPHHLKLTPLENPTGWKADGNDVVLIQVEVVDKDGRRCPLDNRVVKFSIKGPAEYRGGIAKTKNANKNANQAALNSTSAEANGKTNKYDMETWKRLNHVLSDTLPVECGVNRVMLRSLNKKGNVTVKATAEGLPAATLTLATLPVEVKDGLTTYMPADGLQCRLDRGETPSSPSFKQKRREVAIFNAKAGSGNDVSMSYDTYENTQWTSKAETDSAWVTYELCENTKIDEIVMKLGNFRATTYPIAVYAGDSLIWKGWTPKTLSFIHIPMHNAPASSKYTIRMTGNSTTRDAFGEVKEMDSRNNEKANKESRKLKIIEIEFLKNL